MTRATKSLMSIAIIPETLRWMVSKMLKVLRRMMRLPSILVPIQQLFQSLYTMKFFDHSCMCISLSWRSPPTWQLQSLSWWNLLRGTLNIANMTSACSMLRLLQPYKHLTPLKSWVTPNRSLTKYMVFWRALTGFYSWILLHVTSRQWYPGYPLKIVRKKMYYANI